MAQERTYSVTRGGQSFGFRVLRRHEVRELRERHGIDLFSLSPQRLDEAMDLVCTMVCDEETCRRLDLLGYPDYLAVVGEILKEMVGSGEEEKNS